MGLVDKKRKITKANAKKRRKNKYFFAFSFSIIIIVIVRTPTRPFNAILSNRNFDALQGKAFTELGALDHTRELLGRKDLEGFGKDRRQDWCRLVINHRDAIGVVGIRSSHVGKAHLESTESKLPNDM